MIFWGLGREGKEVTESVHLVGKGRFIGKDAYGIVIKQKSFGSWLGNEGARGVGDHPMERR